MRERLEEIRNKISDLWEKTDRRNKIIAVIAAVLILAIIIFLIITLTADKYEVLYGDLSLADMGEITAKLDELGITWKTGENGNSILVPQESKNKVKIELATYGLPKEGYSFREAFDESSWTMTDYDKKQRMKHALQSELASTISEIDGIKSAKVYIDSKEKTNFVLDNDDSKTTASVFVIKDPSKNLGGDKVKAIKNLVAAAVSMDSEDVIITDNDGNLLESDPDGGESSLDQFAMKESLEKRINNSIRKFLTNVYGPGNVDVHSSVKINMDSEKTEIVEFAPPVEDSEEGIPRSIEEADEHMTGGLIGGTPGVESNPDDYNMLEDMGDRYDKASKVINYELNEINREIRKAPGQVESITVAVLINEKSLPNQEMTPEKEEEITNLVYAATGLDTQKVKVNAEEFIDSQEVTGMDGELEGKMMDWKIILAIIVILALAAGGAFYYVRKKQEDAERELEEALLEESLAMTTRMRDVDGREYEDIDLDFKAEESHMKAQINKFVDKNPDAVTQLLRSWLNE